MFLKAWKDLQVFERVEKAIDKTVTATNKTNDKLKGNCKDKR